MELPILAHQGAVWAAQFGNERDGEPSPSRWYCERQYLTFRFIRDHGWGLALERKQWGLSIVNLRSFLTEAILSAEFACVVLPA